MFIVRNFFGLYGTLFGEYSAAVPSGAVYARKKSEIARVTRPFKVIGVAAKNADVSRRCVNHANVFDLSRLIKVKKVAVVQHLDADRRAGRGLCLFCCLQASRCFS